MPVFAPAPHDSPRSSGILMRAGISPQNSWNHYITTQPTNPEPSLAHLRTTSLPALNYSQHLTIPPPPVPIHPLYYLLYVLYLCYYLLFITDCVPSPTFILNTYNFNCQTITMCPPCLFLLDISRSDSALSRPNHPY